MGGQRHGGRLPGAKQGALLRGLQPAGGARVVVRLGSHGGDGREGQERREGGLRVRAGTGAAAGRVREGLKSGEAAALLTCNSWHCGGARRACGALREGRAGGPLKWHVFKCRCIALAR